MGVVYCIPVVGDFWFAISPVILAGSVMLIYSEQLMKIRTWIKSRRATKAKLLELREIQVKIQEEALDRELKEAKRGRRHDRHFNG